MPVVLRVTAIGVDKHDFILQLQQYICNRVNQYRCHDILLC